MEDTNFLTYSRKLDLLQTIFVTYLLQFCHDSNLFNQNIFLPRCHFVMFLGPAHLFRLAGKCFSFVEST